MMAWCDNCQKNTISVAIKGMGAHCASCGEAHLSNFSKISIQTQVMDRPVGGANSYARGEGEDLQLETMKYLTPELLARMESGSDDLAGNKRNANSPSKRSEESREQRVMKEIESLEKSVRNLVHQSKPGVPKPKALKTNKIRPKVDLSAANQNGHSNSTEPQSDQFGAGSTLGELHLRVDRGHIKHAELGRLQDPETSPAQLVQNSSDSASESGSSPDRTMVESIQNQILEQFPHRSFGIRLSSLAISLSWCVQLMLGISYFQVMPVALSWLWIGAQTIGTVSLGYIIAWQVWDTDRNGRMTTTPQAPQSPTYSRKSRSTASSTTSNTV